MMVVGMAKPTLHLDLPSVARDYDFVVIDGAPRVNELGRAAILASDTILIPVQPSHDVWAAAQTVELIREAQQYKTRLRAAFVINRKIVNTAIGRDVVTCWFRSLLDGHARPQSQKKLPLRAARGRGPGGPPGRAHTFAQLRRREDPNDPATAAWLSAIARFRTAVEAAYPPR
jgi:cellulose biosynthesis protein BcsQ